MYIVFLNDKEHKKWRSANPPLKGPYYYALSATGCQMFFCNSSLYLKTVPTSGWNCEQSPRAKKHILNLFSGGGFRDKHGGFLALSPIFAAFPSGNFPADFHISFAVFSPPLKDIRAYG
jgi:hypothetical protein